MQIFAGSQFAFAVSTDDEVYGWGRNDKYQLGIDGSHQAIPSLVGALVN